MKKYLLPSLGALALLGIVLAFAFEREIDRLSLATSLFSGEEMYDSFNRIDEIFPTAVMSASPDAVALPAGETTSLPQNFLYEGKRVAVGDFLSETDTSALLVLRDGRVRYEQYTLTGGPKVRWLSMSVAKSFTSALVGIAVAEGHIRSIEEPITAYLPELEGSAYDGVRIKDVLQMSSGAGWNEDYSDPDSDINRFGRILAVGGSLAELAARLERAREPGTYNLYNSMDTQVLGMLLVQATGRPIAEYMEEKLWHPLGMSSEGHWMIDDHGLEMAFMGLNATARDYARMGELYRNRGRAHGRQIVPAAWVHASVTPDAPHLLPGENPASDYPMGYGYQWWVMDGDEGEYSAIGVYNQFVYVNPTRGLVIVKLSANSDYGTTEDESSYREFETIELFRAIGERVVESDRERAPG